MELGETQVVEEQVVMVLVQVETGLKKVEHCQSNIFNEKHYRYIDTLGTTNKVSAYRVKSLIKLLF